MNYLDRFEKFLKDAERGPDSIERMTPKELENLRHNLKYFMIIAVVLVLAALLKLVPGVILIAILYIASWKLISKKALREE